MIIADKHTQYNIVCIGAGANGSHFVRNLLQDISTYGAGRSTSFYRKARLFGTLTIVDGDKVEQKNLSNQLFDVEDINAFKVDALAERYGTHYEVDVMAVAEYVTSIEELHELFSLNEENNKNKMIPILIGLVDNNRTRMLMHEYFHSYLLDELLYIDVGVEGVLLKEELPNEPLVDEKIMGSGFSGQVVCGYKKYGEVFLPPVADVYPTILADEESVFPNQSCGDLILQNPQRSATNKMAAQLTNTFMNNLFHSGEIVQEEIIFNARFGSAQTRFVSKRTKQLFKNFFEEMNDNDATSSIVS
ncbi:MULTISPECIES: ThiF family adenylyltransferase [unclassified Sporosarcina]|uniref:ThiF family adenylyltransferase n=1 Tax=unclassified Sporosarcina TaxID=2647733 RepID=UPI001A92F3D3|nr:MULTISPECIES: ThiF family adenylyltransferase [unclassified Sporosarcina]MBO0588163.1 ThiF family adenylyltransferase [Sporosarcina sp. E16_8]MBO0601917.1 ThiF family adenylyltransferase [Sporosarcina sp. E16_3]